MSRRLSASAILFIDALQKVLNLGGNHFGGEKFAAEPQEGNVHSLFLKGFQDGLVQSVGFSYLPLHTVAKDRPLEMALGNGNQDADARCHDAD